MLTALLLALWGHQPTSSTTAVHCHPVVCVQHRYDTQQMGSSTQVKAYTRTRPTNTRNALLAPWTPWTWTSTRYYTR